MMDTSTINRADLRLLEAVGVTMLTPRKKEFKLFTILLNEERPQLPSSKSTSEIVSDRIVTDDMISKLGKLLKLKIQSHSCDNVDMFTADEVVKNNMPTLVSVMFRLSAEDFVRTSKTTFKIIECRNSTKLSTDWKPSLVDVILELGHQVIIVELCDFPHYTDFAYAILRQLSYEWKIKLPRSIFYPDDVCIAEHSNDQQVIIVSPKMPDDDIIDLASRIQDNLKYEIIRMMQESCANGLRNHLLKRDLRIGNFSDTEIGLQAICHVYRALQRKLKEEGTNVQMGKTSDAHHLLATLAGDSLVAAEAFLEYCNNPRPGLTPRKEKRKISTAASSIRHDEREGETGSGDNSNGTTPRAVESHKEEDPENKEDSDEMPKQDSNPEEDEVIEKDILDEILNAIQNLRPNENTREDHGKASWKDFSKDQVQYYSRTS